MRESETPSRVVQLELAVLSPDQPAGIIRLTDMGVALDDNMTYEQWVEGLKLFKWAQSKLKMGFSGYVQWGTAKFGKPSVDTALGQLEFDLGMVTSAIEIASVPSELRHDNLSAEHYVVLARADLKMPARAKWSRLASEQNLTPGQLKASIAAGEVVSTDQVRQQQHGIISVHGMRQNFDIWLRRVDGLKGVLKMEDAEIKDILGELKEIAEFYEAIKTGLKKKAAKKKARKPAKPKA